MLLSLRVCSRSVPDYVRTRYGYIRALNTATAEVEIVKLSGDREPVVASVDDVEPR
jgi:hypothetical protein